VRTRGNAQTARPRRSPAAGHWPTYSRTALSKPHDAPADIRAVADGLVSDLQQYLTWAARGHRSGEWRAREAGTSHDHSSDRAPAHDAGAPGPDRNTDPPQGRYDQDLHRIGACPQTGAAQANAPSSIPMPLEHILSDAGFKPILGIVRSVGRRCPRGDRNVQAPLNARINGAHPRRGTHLTKPLNGILGCAPPSPTRAQLVAVKPTSSHGSCHPGPMRGSGPPEVS
jgi:hypothetical protein